MNKIPPSSLHLPALHCPSRHTTPDQGLRLAPKSRRPAPIQSTRPAAAESRHSTRHSAIIQHPNLHPTRTIAFAQLQYFDRTHQKVAPGRCICATADSHWLLLLLLLLLLSARSVASSLASSIFLSWPCLGLSYYRLPAFAPTHSSNGSALSHQWPPQDEQSLDGCNPTRVSVSAICTSNRIYPLFPIESEHIVVSTLPKLNLPFIYRPISLNSWIQCQLQYCTKFRHLVALL